MPEARSRPNDKNVNDVSERLYAVSAEGNIKVVAEPAAEGDVPAAPELRNACGNIRIVEVFGKAESENASESYRHV